MDRNENDLSAILDGKPVSKYPRSEYVNQPSKPLTIEAIL